MILNQNRFTILSLFAAQNPKQFLTKGIVRLVCLIKLICFISFQSKSSASCLLKSTAINLYYFLNKDLEVDNQLSNHLLDM